VAAQYEEALKLSPKNTNVRQQLAEFYGKDDATLARAEEQYRKLIEDEPENQSYYTQFGALIKKKTKNKDDALAEYRKFIEAKPTITAPRYVLANTLATREDQASKDAAQKEYEEILKIKPEDQAALMSLAQMFEKAKKPDEAINYFKKVVDKDPSQRFALDTIKKLVDEKKEKDPNAVADWLVYLKTISMKKDAGRGGVYDLLLSEYSRAGRAPEAIAHIEGLLKKDPKDVSAMLSLGAHYSGAGNQEKALAIYKKALDAGSSDQSAVGRIEKAIADVYFGQQKYADALKHYKQWQSRQFYFFGVDQAQIRIAQCLEFLGKTDEALAEYEKLSAGDQNNPDIRGGLQRLRPKPLAPASVPLAPGPGGGLGPEGPGAPPLVAP